jgi:hypothetical protein
LESARREADELGVSASCSLSENEEG